MSEFRGGGREEVPHTRVHGRRPGGGTPRLSSGAAAEKSYPTSREPWLRRRRRARGATPRSRSGGCSEEIPLVQDKEQQLCFAVAALKRYPMSKVRETQIRW